METVMDSDRLSRWLSLVANLGVFGGLLLVALELNQTTNAIRGSNYYSAAESSAEWNKLVAESERLAPIAMTYNAHGIDALSDEERYRYALLNLAAFRRHDGAFFQYELGLLSEDWYETIFRNDMETWVPRWREFGFLDEGSESYILEGLRPTFAAEVRKYMGRPARQIIPDVQSDQQRAGSE